MTSRLEKYYESKKLKRKSKYKILYLLAIIVILIGGLFIVDDSLKNLMCIQDKSIFNYDYDSRIHTLHLFGENHYLEQDKIDSVVGDVKSSFNSVKNNIEIILSKIKDKIIKD